MNSAEFELALQELKAGKDDISPSDIVVFSEPLRSTLNQAVRTGIISLTDLALNLEVERWQARELADVLVARHLFHVSASSSETEILYETRISSMTRRMPKPNPDLWKKIDD